MTREQQTSKVEEGLLQAMSSLDNQIAREIHRRTPAELEAHGVDKWEPHGARVENVTTVLLDALGDEKIQLDSLLVLAQATAKALHLAIADLGEDGLGEVRTRYCLRALHGIAHDAERGRELIVGKPEVGLM